MVFKFHMAFALGLIAMVAGVYLISKVRSEGMCCKGFARVVGWFVVITAFLGLICITYHSVIYMKAGLYCPHKMMHGRHGKPCAHMMMKKKCDCAEAKCECGDEKCECPKGACTCPDAN